MHLEKTEKRSLRRILQLGGACAVSAAMVVTMAVPLASAADIGSNMYGMNPNSEINLADGTSSVPSTENGDQALSYDDYLIGGSGGTGTASMDYLDIVGVDMIGSLGYNWGTKINQEPNSFVWNLALDAFEGCPQLSGDAASITDQVGFVKQGWSGTMTYGTLVAYHPQVLAASNDSTYETMVADINAKDLEEGGAGDYNPVIVSIAGDAGGVGISVFNDYLWNVAVGIESINNYMAKDDYMALSEQNKANYVTSRYCEPSETAEKYTGFFRGIQWYILSQVEGTPNMKTVAYVTGYDDGTVTMQGVDPTYDGASSTRPLEGLGQVVNWAGIDNPTTTSQSGDVITYTTSDLSIFKDVDIVFTSISSGGGDRGGGGGGGGGPTSVMPLDDDDDEASDVDKFHDAIDAQGFSGQFCESPSTAVGNQGFGLVRNQIEMIGYVYPEYFNIAYGLKYFWVNFGHVKDEYAAAVMEDADSGQLLPEGMTKNGGADGNTFDVSGYSEADMNALIAEGEEYYLANYKNEDSNCYNSHMRAYGNTEASTNYQFGYFGNEAPTTSELYAYQSWFEKTTGITPVTSDEILKNTIDEIIPMIEELMQEVADNSITIAQLNRLLAQLEDENLTATAAIEALQQTIATLQQEATTSDSTIAQLQKMLEELQTAVEKITNPSGGTNNGGGTTASAKAQTIKVAKKVTAKKGKKATIKVSGAKNALVAAGANAKAKKALKITVKGKTKVIVKAKKKGTFKVQIYAKASSSYKASAKKTVTVKVK